jgi:hypothetical protein
VVNQDLQVVTVRQVMTVHSEPQVYQVKVDRLEQMDLQEMMVHLVQVV